MSRKYKFHNPEGIYFISFAVVFWIDLFIREEYREVILESFSYCQKNKGLKIHAWCIMTSHLHMIISSTHNLSSNVRDLKRHTSIQLRKTIEEHSRESRKEWILWMMKKAGKQNGNNTDFQLWQQHNQPIELINTFMINQKILYLHNNPIEAGFVEQAIEYKYSSARDYAGEQGPIKVDRL